MGDRCVAQSFNYYHFDRSFIPCTNSPGVPTRYRVIAGARELSGIVGPTNICIISNDTQATEYEVVGLGFDSPGEAWASALNAWSSCPSNQPGKIYDNVGWLKLTHEAYSNWGGYIWCLQNTIAFTSSASSIYVSPAGATSEIASVLVGTLGDFCPKTVVTDVGPVFNTNYPGSGMATEYVARADLAAYYKLVSSNYLAVNDDDSDGDGIPDFADGYDRDGQGNSSDDLSTNDFFVPWPVLLSGYTEPAQAMVSISYNASDPSGVTLGTNGYVPASGYFRLWRTNAAQARNSASILSGGDYIPPGTYPAASLGFITKPQLVDFYIEPVVPVLNQPLVFEVDPDGPGPKGAVCVDKLICSVLMVESVEIVGAPADGLVVENGDDVTFVAHILPSDFVPPADEPKWYYQKLDADGSWESWQSFGANADGTQYVHTATESGIFRVETVLTVGGVACEKIYERTADDPHSTLKEGEPDAFGVVDNAIQLAVREEALGYIGSTYYSSAGSLPAWRDPFGLFDGQNKCNVFVADVCEGSGADVDPPTAGVYLGGPPSANNWAGMPDINDPNAPYPIPNWTLLFDNASPQPGHVCASGYEISGSSGHAGIVDYDGQWISASSAVGGNVNRKAEFSSYRRHYQSGATKPAGQRAYSN